MSVLEEKKSYLSNGTLWLMTVGGGFVVANNYYNQPLLGLISRELGESKSATSTIAIATQIGYAAGLLLLIPLCDMFKRKRIILIDFVFMIVSLLVFALGRSLEVLVVSSFFIGFTSVVPQIFVPIAAQLSKPKDKNRNVGIVMSGLLLGILASRVFSGVLGEHAGWRVVFFSAAGFMVVLGLLLAKLLPQMEPTFKGSYKQLMSSILYYAKTIPALRLASLRGALGFGAFSIFWTTLAFHLEQPPFFRGSDIAGMLGLVGIVGASAGALAGTISGRVNRYWLIMITIIMMFVSWGVFALGGYTYIGLIIGIIFLDMGLQGMHVTNQTIIFSTHPEATNRLNTFYMVSYFIGGALGTFVGARAWAHYGWTGVSIAGASFVVVALVAHLFLGRNKTKASYKS